VHSKKSINSRSRTVNWNTIQNWKL